VSPPRGSGGFEAAGTWGSRPRLFRCRPFGAGLLILLLLLVAVAPLPAQKPSREAELAGLRMEIAKLTERLAAARKAATGVQGEIDAVEVELRLQEARLSEATTARDLAAKRVADGEAEVARLQGALDTARDDLKRHLTGLYRLGRQGYLRLFLSLQPDRRLLPSIRLMRYLARRDRSAIDRYQEARVSLDLERDQLVARREETERWIDSERTRRQQLVAVRQHKEALLGQLQKEGRSLAARSTELADREKKLAAFLDLLYGRATESPAGTPMQQFRGVLDWPVEGKVTAGFGTILEPRYRTRVPHNGLDIAVAAAGGPVKAVFPGKVLYAAPFQGYGDTVIVQHPGRVFTLYAGLASMRVGKEDMLSLGDTVGLASDKLYFEIRVENRPEDPLSWLR
jgi:septal ring factor EnvC (AmiA/AmiB activator)